MKIKIKTNSLWTNKGNGEKSLESQFSSSSPSLRLEPAVTVPRTWRLPPSPSPSSLPIAAALRPHWPAGHLPVRAMTPDFSGFFFEAGGDDDRDPPSASSIALEDKEEPQFPPGLLQHETMAALRPDVPEDERLALTQRYEGLLVAGGGMCVGVFNRGVIPLAYSLKKKNKAGETNTYLDGIYLLFTYFTRLESIDILEIRLKTDDDVIRSSSFKIRKRKC